MMQLPMSSFRRERDLQPKAVEKQRSATDIRLGNPVLRVIDRVTWQILIKHAVQPNTAYPVTQFDGELFAERLKLFNQEHETIYTDEDVDVLFAKTKGIFVTEKNGGDFNVNPQILFSLETDERAALIASIGSSLTPSAPQILRPLIQRNDDGSSFLMTPLRSADSSSPPPASSLSEDDPIDAISIQELKDIEEIQKIISRTSSTTLAPVTTLGQRNGAEDIMAQLQQQYPTRNISLDQLHIEVIYVPAMINRDDVTTLLQTEKKTVAARVEKVFTEMFSHFLEETVRLRAERFVHAYSDIRDQLTHSGQASITIPNTKFLDLDLLRAAFSTGGFQTKVQYNLMCVTLLVAI